MNTATYDFPYHAFDLFCFLKTRQKAHVFLLDSSLTDASNGRYSLIGYDPFCVMSGSSLVDFAEFKKRCRAYRSQTSSALTPLAGGAVGFLSYDLGREIVGLPPRPSSADTGPLFHFGFYDVVLTVDHLERKLHVTTSGLPEETLRAHQAGGEARLKEANNSVEEFLARPSSVGQPSSLIGQQPEILSECSKEEYITAVRRALDHIREGDIYEINLSHAIHTSRRLRDPLEIYRRLRELSPSHFSAYYDAGQCQLLSSSPERFLSLHGGIAQIRPMKGTRPRGRTPDDDARLRHELIQSPKEIAELLMVTDLERNDLGRVCEFGSVKVSQMRTIEDYKTVFQATSTIEGTLRRDCDGFDLIEACFPGGSVTGCPKIRAMQIIDELEQSKRGIYTGALGYLDFSGNLDFNILIRTLVITGDQVSFRVGGGIVADSDPAMEYEETWVKARAMIECLG